MGCRVKQGCEIARDSDTLYRRLKMNYTCAIDFGTTNSVVCYLDAQGQQTLLSEPTVIFFPERKTTESPIICVGHDAVKRSVSMGMKGRFIQSLKSVLHDPDFDYTRIAGVPYSPVELVSIILSYLKAEMEKRVGHTIERVTIGRPYIFSETPSEDALAEKRIRVAAGLSGFKEIQFQLEPIGAAYAYEATLTKPETVLVVDIGGGTTDYTVMKLDPSKKKVPDRRSDILSTGGVHVGGDDFDSSIMWNQLTDFFGRQSKYEEWGKLYDFPIHFFTRLCTWYDIPSLKEEPFREDLRGIWRTSTQKEAVGRLRALIEDDLGYAVYKSIEAAKKELSTMSETMIYFDSPTLQINHPITQIEFGNNMAPFVEQIETSMTQALAQANCTDSDIDTVLLTGGSSLVGMLKTYMLARFGEKKLVQDENCFHSIALGLALA